MNCPKITRIVLALRTLNAAHRAEREGAMRNRDVLVEMTSKILADGPCETTRTSFYDENGKTIPPTSLSVH